jgi:hypothetical protein
MVCLISLVNSSQRFNSWTSYWSYISPMSTTLSWCFWFSTLVSTLSFLGYCRMSTLNKANVSCHVTCFDDNFGWVMKYFKVKLSIHTTTTTTSLEPM